jgi:hypothetical protein
MRAFYELAIAMGGGWAGKIIDFRASGQLTCPLYYSGDRLKIHRKNPLPFASELVAGAGGENSSLKTLFLTCGVLDVLAFVRSCSE